MIPNHRTSNNDIEMCNIGTHGRIHNNATTLPNSSVESIIENNNLPIEEETQVSVEVEKTTGNKKIHPIKKIGVLCMVFATLFLDNVILTVIVPIVPDMLRKQEKQNAILDGSTEIPKSAHIHIKIGILFASKAIVQILCAPFVAIITDRFGNRIPLLFGSAILISSSLMFGLVNGYFLLFLARALQGLGSSCISISGLSLLAAYYTNDQERGKVFGLALGGLALGVLVGPVFGGVTYQYAGRFILFMIIFIMASVNGLAQVILLITGGPDSKTKKEISYLKFLKDSGVLFTALTIFLANFGIGLLEPALPYWMGEMIQATPSQQGLPFLASSISYLISTNLSGWLGVKLGRRIYATIGLFMAAVCYIIIPISTDLYQIIVAMGFIGIAIGMVDGTMIPAMGTLVDQKYSSAYGAAFAIADSSFCMGFAVGPLTSGFVVAMFGFRSTMWILGCFSILAAPMPMLIRSYRLKSTITIPRFNP